LKFVYFILALIFLLIGYKNLREILKNYNNELGTKDEEPTLFKFINDFFLLGGDGFMFGIMPILLGTMFFITAIHQK
jgi:hypothetical protein